jgi:hypothetical protein
MPVADFLRRLELKSKLKETLNNSHIARACSLQLHIFNILELYYIHGRTMETGADSNPDLGAEEVELGPEDMAGLEDVRIKYVINTILLFIATLSCNDTHRAYIFSNLLSLF